YPNFTASSAAPDAYALDGATELTTPQHCQDLAEQEIARQVIAQYESLAEDIQRFMLRFEDMPTQQPVAEYAVAALLYRCGFWQPLPPQGELSATTYLYRLLGRQARRDWRSDLPVVSAPAWQSAACLLRDTIEQRLLEEGQQAVFETVRRRCQTGLVALQQ